jgi:hypothetical protein
MSSLFGVQFYDLSMDEQERNNESQHAASSETAQQGEAELLRLKGEVERQRPQQSPGILALFTAYLLLVGTVIAGGMLASYAGHVSATQVIFKISIALLLLIPIIVICYLVFSIHRRYPFLKKIDAFVDRHLQGLFWFGTITSYIGVIASIIEFPRHPRISLLEMAINLITLSSMQTIKRVVRLYDHLDHLYDHLDFIQRVLDKIIEIHWPTN